MWTAKMKKRCYVMHRDYKKKNINASLDKRRVGRPNKYEGDHEKKYESKRKKENTQHQFKFLAN